jgi:hypothetical protein
VVVVADGADTLQPGPAAAAASGAAKLLLSWLLAWQLLHWVSESECLVDSQNPLNTLSPPPGPDPAGCWAGRRGRPDQGGTG